MFTPATRADIDDPTNNEEHAASMATSDAEHAVSRLMLGPNSPKAYEIRPEAIDALAPVLVYGPGVRCAVTA